MSKHRRNTNSVLPSIFGSRKHMEQVVAVQAEADHIHLSVTAEAGVELARILVQYGSATRHGHVTPTGLYDAELWHDVGLALNADVLRVTTGPRASRYVPVRRSHAPLILVGEQ